MNYGLRQQMADFYGLSRHSNPHINTILSALQYAISSGRADELAGVAKEWMGSEDETVELTIEYVPTVEYVPIKRE